MEGVHQAARELKRAVVRRLVINSAAWRQAEAEATRDFARLFAREFQGLDWAAIARIVERLAERREKKKAAARLVREIVETLTPIVGTKEEAWREAAEATALKGYAIGGKRALLFLGGGDFRLRNPDVTKFLRKHAARLVSEEIGPVSRERVATQIIAAAENDEGLDGVRRRLRETYASMSARRARTIAVTELSFASGHAKMRSFRAAGVGRHEWITAFDDRVDEDCEANAEAGTVPVGAAFPSGVKEEPAHPNCRCTTAPVVPPDFEPSELWEGD